VLYIKCAYVICVVGYGTSVVIYNFKSLIPLYAAFLEETVSYVSGLEILWSVMNA
jgi:hypothetical protein